MEAEADFGLGLLGTEVSHRRRSTSVSDDYSVQKTNDDATECNIQLSYTIICKRGGKRGYFGGDAWTGFSYSYWLYVL